MLTENTPQGSTSQDSVCQHVGVCVCVCVCVCVWGCICVMIYRVSPPQKKKREKKRAERSIYPWLKCHENEAKFDNDYVFINDDTIKTTLTISLILVSFFLEDNELKIWCISEYQRNENQAFRFFLGTPGISNRTVFRKHLLIM